MLLALSAGLTAPGSGSAGMDCEQVAPQAPANDCGTEGMPAGACAVACYAGTCITPTLARADSAIKTPQPLAQLPARQPDRARAPDTAPPKHFVT